MARLKQSSGASKKLGRRKGGRQNSDFPPILGIFVGVIGVVAVFICVLMYFAMDDSSGGTTGVGGKPLRRKKTVPSLDNIHNAIARDIIKSLDCDNLSLNNTLNSGEDNPYMPGDGAVEGESRRRLQEEATDDINGMGQPAGEEGMNYADDMWGGGDYNPPPTYNGLHLMCLAAGAEHLEKELDKDAFKCDVSNTRREALLDIWSSARANQIPLEVIKKSLEMASETEKFLVDKNINFWSPTADESVDYYIEGLNKDDGSLKGLDGSLGAGRLFVDIGSGLGLSTMAISFLYPGTTILSIEPAGPSWMLQKINLVCNLPLASKQPALVLAGVGTRNDAMGKMMWRPSSTGTTRAWTPVAEKHEEDIELVVRLRTLRSILAEAAAEEDVESDSPSSVVLNIDCEGCEYNLIPAMSDEEFTAIDVIIGTTGVHWGYIPKDKLPSSNRGAKTHERLCHHYDFARQSIECCAFPSLTVKHEGDPTVSGLLGELCDGFKAWADEKQLYASNDDYGWTEMSSMSGM